MFNTKPYIALCKEDETAFVNARTYWSVSGTVGQSPDHRTYEVRVKHHYPEDTFTFWFLDRASHDDIELHTHEAWEARRQAVAENEPQLCDLHKRVEDGRCPFCGEFEGDNGCVTVGCDSDMEDCENCKAASLNYADAVLADRCREMDKTEERIYQELRRHWDALVLLFNPTINL